MSDEKGPPRDLKETRIREDEEKLRNYLLGLSSPQEADEVDYAILDEDLGPVLDVIEDELVEDYVSGELSDSERSHFENQLLFRPELIRKIRVSKMLSVGAGLAKDDLSQAPPSPRTLTQIADEAKSKDITLLDQIVQSGREGHKGVDAHPAGVTRSFFDSALQNEESPPAIELHRTKAPSPGMKGEQQGSPPPIVRQLISSLGVKGEQQSSPPQWNPLDRALLRMVFVEKRNTDDVCRELGVDPEYVRVVLHRARKAFETAFPDVGRKRD